MSTGTFAAVQAEPQSPIDAQRTTELEVSQSIAIATASSRHTFEPRPVDAVLRALRHRDRRAPARGLRPVIVLLALSSCVTSGRPILYRGAARRPRRRGPPHVQAADPAPRRRVAPRPLQDTELDRLTESEMTRVGRAAARVAARRAAAAVERPARRHVDRRPAADPARLLRGAVVEIPAVLAAAGRPARPDRLRAAADAPRHVLGREARPRPRVPRRPLGGLVPAAALRDRRPDGQAPPVEVPRGAARALPEA